MITTQQTPATKWDDEKMRDAWKVSNEWIDSQIREWGRMRNDGLPYREDLMRSMHKRCTKAKAEGEVYFMFLAYASLGLDPIVDRQTANLNQLHHRTMTLLFYAKLIHEVGGKRVRARWDAMVAKGEVHP